MKIQCPFCSQITELEHVDHGNKVECVCSETFLISPETVLEEYTEIDNRIPEKIGPYPVISLLGFGGMGKVYLGHHHALDIPVAIKMLRMEYMTDRNACERFIQTCRICARLDHPNIVRVYDCGYLEENVFLVMEYLSGGSTKDLLQQNGPLQYDHAAFIMLEVCSGLLEAEKLGIVHRDIKPENIMFDKDGTVKILDLGLSKISGDERLNRKTITENLCSLGTAQYMAPEQAVDAANCDSRADVYSIGVTLYQFCTGKLPFDSSDPHELRRMHAQDKPLPPSEIIPEFKSQMEYIILRCLEKQRSDRYSSISELALDLEALLKNRILPSTFNRTSPEERQSSFRMKERFLQRTISGVKRCAMLFSVVMGIILLVSGSFWYLRDDRVDLAARSRKQAKETGKIASADALMESLSIQAADLAEKKLFRKAAELYLDYKGPFEQETRAKRLTLAQGYMISEKNLLMVSVQEDGQFVDTDSDRSQ